MSSRWAASLLVACAMALLPVPPAAAAGPAAIAMITEGYAPPFWQDVIRGALRAARDFGVALTVESAADAPAGGSAAGDPMTAVVSAALARHPAALCIGARDSAALPPLLPLLQKARAAKVPVIWLASAADNPLVTASVSTDNAAAAGLAADKLAALPGGSGTVGVILPDASSTVSVERRDGFLREMGRRSAGVRLLDPQYAGGDPTAAAALVKDMAASGLTGLFCADPDAAAGVLAGLKDQGLTGRVTLIGFDSGKDQMDAVRAGTMAGAVTEDAIRTGYRTVEAAVDAINGRRLPRRIDAGFHWYDASNIDDPAIAILLHP